MEELLSLNQALRQHCSPVGVERLESEANHSKSEYERLTGMCQGGIKRLGDVLSERQGLAERLKALSEVVTRQGAVAEKKMVLGRENVKDTLPALKVCSVSLCLYCSALWSIFFY